MMQCIQKRVAACHTQRNLLATIHDLPQDIFSHIFRTTLGDAHTYYDELTNMSLVCKAWKGFIDASPQFWRRVSSEYPTKFLDVALRNGRGVPLDATFVSEDGGSPDRRLAFLQRLAALGWPVRSFTIYGHFLNENEIPFIKQFLESPAPLLKKLVVQSLLHDQRTFIPIKNPFDGNAPRLEAIVAQNVAMDWDELPLPSLKTLSLAGFGEPPEHRLTVPSLVELLKRCPVLETLQIQTMQFGQSAQDTVVLDPVVLPHLRILDLDAIATSSACDIIQRIALPVCERVSVECRDDVPAHHQTARLIEALMEKLPTQEVVVNGRGTWLDVAGQRWSVKTTDTTDQGTTPADTYRRLFIDSLPPVARRAVSKYHFTNATSVPEIRNAILPVLDEAFPELTEIFMTVEGEFELDLLSTPTARGWLLPKLETFSLNDYSLGVTQLSVVVEMAQVRRQPRTIEGRQINPAPLRTFRTPSRIVPNLVGGGLAVFEQLQHVFETIEYDGTPITNQPLDANVVFIWGSDGWHAPVVLEEEGDEGEEMWA